MILGSDPGMVNEWDGDLKPSEMFGTALSGGRLRVGWKGSETGKDTGSRRIQPFVKPQSVADTDHAVRTVEGEVAVPSMVRSRTNIGFGCQAMAFGEYLGLLGHIVGDLLVKAGEIQALFHGNTKDQDQI